MKKFLLILFITGLYFNDSTAQTQTQFGKGAGEYQELFERLKTRLLQAKESKTVTLGGRERKVFVPWIRDHVHVMKAMKYFSPDISSFWEFYVANQTPEGLYYDYYFPLSDGLKHRMKLFDQRYWKVFPDDDIQMHRLPVEADLEYLMVEGAYDIWQATGNNKYLEKWTNALEEGMNYSMTDSLRWSKKFQLVKRGYTLDTWDFMQLPVSRAEYVRQGKDVQKGIFDIDNNTPMGIMHGDNSGMYAASKQLAQLFASLGNQSKAKVWAAQAENFRTRTNRICWNGKYYAHFVPDDPMPSYLQMDQNKTLSLSNPYDINRGLPTEEMAESIIQTYQALKAQNKLNAFAEWFGIYPPVEPHFADYKPGSYMNGGVNTIVGGELAKAALQHGFEEYGIDILNRLLELVHQHQGDLPVAYQPDGKVDEGIPDNWGQAAVMSALIEGLAGVVDKDQLFKQVEISPRWMATGKNEVAVTVAYGPSGKAVHYTYRHDPSKRKIAFDFSGDPEKYTIRILLPKGKEKESVQLDSHSTTTHTEKVRNSRYVVIDGISQGKHTMEVTYQ